MTNKTARWLLCVVLVFVLAASLALAACKQQSTATFAGGQDATGDAPQAITVNTGDVITLPANTFSRQGYDFAGWSDGSKVYQPGDEYTLAQDVTFTAQWTEKQETPPAPAEYTLSFGLGAHAASGAVAPQSKKLQEGATYALPDAPAAAEGWEFAGWGESKLQAGATFTMPAEDTELVAQWTEQQVTPPAPAEYTLSFDLGAHAASGAVAPQSKKLQEGATYALPAAPAAAEGWEFAGWGESKLQAGATFTMPAEDTELVAQWTEKQVTPPAPAEYTLSFGLGEHAASGAVAPQSKKLQEGATYALPAAPAAAEGWEFAGWGESKLQAGATYTMPAEDTELVAQWTEVSQKEAPFTTQPFNGVVAHNSTTSSGRKIFGLLHFYADGTGDLYITNIDMESDIIQLTSFNYTVSADGTITITKFITEEDNAIKVTTPVSGTIEGRTVSITISNKSAAGTAVDYKFESTLYKLTLAKVDGTSNLEQYLYEGAECDLTNAEYQGHNLVKFTVGGSDKDLAWGSSFKMPAADTVVDYVWEEIQLASFTVTYKPGEGATGNEYTDTVTAEEYKFLYRTNSNLQYEYEGYYFKGWQIEGDESGKLYQGNDTYTTPGAITVVAQWGKCITVTYANVENADTNILTLGIDLTNYTPSSNYYLPYGQSQFGNLVYFSKSGFTLKGWTSSDDEGADKQGTIYAPGSKYTLSKDVTFTAVWEKPITSDHFAENFGTYIADSEFEFQSDSTVEKIVLTANTIEIYVKGDEEPTMGKSIQYNESSITFTVGTIEVTMTFQDDKMTVSYKSQLSAKTATLTKQSDATVKYSVKYEGGEHGSGLELPASEQYAEGANVSVGSGLGNVTEGEDHYAFAGWSDGKGNTYQPGGQFEMPAEDVTLTAQWESYTPTTKTLNDYLGVWEGEAFSDTEIVKITINSDGISFGTKDYPNEPTALENITEIKDGKYLVVTAQRVRTSGPNKTVVFTLVITFTEDNKATMEIDGATAEFTRTSTIQPSEPEEKPAKPEDADGIYLNPDGTPDLAAATHDDWDNFVRAELNGDTLTLYPESGSSTEVSLTWDGNTAKGTWKGSYKATVVATEGQLEITFNFGSDYTSMFTKQGGAVTPTTKTLADYQGYYKGTIGKWDAAYITGNTIKFRSVGSTFADGTKDFTLTEDKSGEFLKATGSSSLGMETTDITITFTADGVFSITVHVVNTSPIAPKDETTNGTLTKTDIVTVTFELGEEYTGDTSAYAPQVMFSGELPSTFNKQPAQEGYTFDGWYVADSDVEFSFEQPVTQSTTVKAKWTKLTTVTVTYVENGQNVTGMPESPQTIEAGSILNQPTPDPVREGYKFLGWYTSSYDTTKKYTFGQAVNSNLTLYALWGKTLTVKFGEPAAAHTGEAPESIETAGGETITLPDCPYVVEGKIFIGWKLSTEGPLKLYDAKSTFTIGSSVATDITCTPVFGREYTEKTFGKVIVRDDNLLKIADGNWLQYEDYEGYIYAYDDYNEYCIELNEDGTAYVLDGLQGFSFTATDNVSKLTLDGKGNATLAEHQGTYTVKYDDYGSLIGFKLNIGDKDYDIVIGGSYGEYVIDVVITIGDSEYIFGKPTVKVTIKYEQQDNEEGAVPEAQIVDCPYKGETEVTLATPTQLSKAGFVFAGWKLKSGEDEQVYTKYTVHSDDTEIVFVATWKEQSQSGFTPYTKLSEFAGASSSEPVTYGYSFEEATDKFNAGSSSNSQRVINKIDFYWDGEFKVTYYYGDSGTEKSLVTSLKVDGSPITEQTADNQIGHLAIYGGDVTVQFSQNVQGQRQVTLSCANTNSTVTWLAVGDEPQTGGETGGGATTTYTKLSDFVGVTYGYESEEAAGDNMVQMTPSYKAYGTIIEYFSAWNGSYYRLNFNSSASEITKTYTLQSNGANLSDQDAPIGTYEISNNQINTVTFGVNDQGLRTLTFAMADGSSVTWTEIAA